MEYLAKRPFSSIEHNGIVSAGERVTIKSKKLAIEMQHKGLITPAYKTKEDKEKIRVTIDKVSDNGWYRVMHGKKEIGKMRKKEAQAYKEKHD